MKKFLPSIMVILLIIGLIGGCSSIEEIKTYTALDQVISININEEFVIVLDSGEVASGFLWRANYDSDMLKLVDSKFERNENEDSQAVGIKFFKFKALKAGETEITMLYMREWPEQPLEELDEKVFKVNIGQSSD